MNCWGKHFVRELRRIFTDKRIFITMLGGPLLYGFLFGGVYSAGRICHVPIVIVDQDHSALSRDLTGALPLPGLTGLSNLSFCSIKKSREMRICH